MTLTDMVLMEDITDSAEAVLAEDVATIERIQARATKEVRVDIGVNAREEMVEEMVGGIEVFVDIPGVTFSGSGGAGTSQEVPVIPPNFSEPGTGDSIFDIREEELFRDMEREEEGLRVSVVDAVRRALPSRPAFNPATYNPPLHFFIPSGVEVYTPQREDYDADLILRYPTIHLLVTRVKLKVHGGAGHCLAYYNELPDSVKRLVDAIGFMQVIRLLSKTKVDHYLLTALTERWWDTTNTFHFGFGEMTIKPLDFAAITGLRVGGDPIPFDSGLVGDREAVEHLLGFGPGTYTETVGYGRLRRRWLHRQPANDTEAEQMARCYLWSYFIF